MANSSISIQAGEAYAVLGVVMVAAAAMTGIALFAHRAGVTAQRAQAAKRDAENAAKTVDLVNSMSNQAANSPVTDEQAIALLSGGKA